jgi:hypothetical protein
MFVYSVNTKIEDSANLFVTISSGEEYKYNSFSRANRDIGKRKSYNRVGIFWIAPYT